MPQTPDPASSSTDSEPRSPWLRRSAAALTWLIGFAVAIGLVVAAVVIPTGVVVGTAVEDEDSQAEASASTAPASEPQQVTLEATANGKGKVSWEVDGKPQEADFTDTWSEEIEIPSGSWPRVVVTGDIDKDDLQLTCAIKLDDEVVFEQRGTDSTETATCAIFV